MRKNTVLNREENGSSTVEAAFVVSLTIFAVLTAVLMNFYLRDVCAASARIRLDSLRAETEESGAAPAPVFTLTEGSLRENGGEQRVSLRMAGIWPLSGLRYSEAVRREDMDPAARLRVLRQEGLR